MTSEDQIKAVLAKDIKPWEMDGFPCVTGIPEAAAEIAALASTAGAAAGDPVAEACKPWRFGAGGLPSDDSPLIGPYSAGIGYAIDMLAKITNAGEYVCADGSETFEGDVRGTILNVLRAAKLYDDEDGQFASLSAVPASPRSGAGEGEAPGAAACRSAREKAVGQLQALHQLAAEASPPAPAEHGTKIDGKLYANVSTQPFQCPHCDCRSYARIRECKEDGDYRPGLLIRCVECKAVYRDANAVELPITAPAEHGVEIREAIRSALDDNLTIGGNDFDGYELGGVDEVVEQILSTLSQGGGAGRSDRAVEIRELHAALSKGHALLCESGPDRCWVKIGFGWLQDAQDAHGALARFIKVSAPAQSPSTSDAPLYQFREIGEGEGWQFCSKAVYDSFARDPNIDTRVVPPASAQPPSASDPERRCHKPDEHPGALDATCFACGETFKDGDPVYEDVNEGTIHAACVGPEPESYVDEDGEPLKPGDPIPEPGIYRTSDREG